MGKGGEEGETKTGAEWECAVLSGGRGEVQRGKAWSETHKHLHVLEVRATYSSVTLHARCRDKVVTAAGKEAGGHGGGREQGTLGARGDEERKGDVIYGGRKGE